MTAVLQGFARAEAWPLREAFVISRSSRTHVDVVYVEVTDGIHVGRGECQPNTRYDDTPAQAVAQLTACFEAGVTLETDVQALPLSPAAKNGLDCALWDLRAKRAGVRVWDLLGRAAPKPTATVFTLSLGTPEAMADAAQRAVADGKTRLKLKLGGEGDDARVAAVRAAVPDARLVADANEAWTPDMLVPYLRAMAEAGIELLEQPLPAGQDDALAGLNRPIPLCADESCHTADDVPRLAAKYDMVNIKLDKCGGLTEALRLETAAQDADMGIFVGCMLGTSLAMAPALIVAATARWVDLDGVLLLSRDRDHKLAVDAGYHIAAPAPQLWG
ncbi:N-acetyl-D-Glu racemase DgcA [Kordiimonas marina]|uniref:N-acetyl-D-Glu racemase DgcA n=1 Tax=Kordiimonas marina TaxID=2872312 RepID=UPI00248BF8ED|nr:N-acetyl-D-Glu racemase DgcA [Kordiimonas marina]MCJ9429134.1 dipeptide epimerase [Kordiimonas marina]